MNIKNNPTPVQCRAYGDFVVSLKTISYSSTVKRNINHTGRSDDTQCGELLKSS